MHIEKRRSKTGARFRVRVRVQGYPQTTRTFRRRKEAQLWGQQFEADLLAGRLGHPQAFSKTVGEAIDRFLKDQPPGRGEWLLERAKGGILEFWKARLGGVLLSQVRTSMVARERDFLLRNPAKAKRHGGFRKPRSPATANRYCSGLSSIIQYAVEIGWGETNPCRGLRRLREDNCRIRRLSEAEREALFEGCKPDPELLDFVRLALMFGCRKGELEGLRWKDVDLQEMLVLFPKTKNGHPRLLPLSSEALALLRNRLRHRVLSPEDWVFPAPLCSGHSDFSHRFRRAKLRSGIPDLRIHDLRHHAASELASAGVADRTIGEVLGHRTLQMVRRYTHLKTDDLKGAVEVLGKQATRNAG